MPTALMPEGRQRYFNNDGTPCAGGKLWTYAAGTTNPKTTYADDAGLIPNPNPVPLDAKGEAAIYWNGAYKVNLLQADGAQVTGYPVDNVKTDPAGLWGLLTSLASSAGAALLGFVHAVTGSTARTLQDKARDVLDARDIGATVDGVDSTAKILAFFTNNAAYKGKFVIPYGCKFNRDAVYAAIPVNCIVWDESSINQGQPPGYQSKIVQIVTNDTVSNDTCQGIVSSHHAAFRQNNTGTSGSDSGAKRFNSYLRGAGYRWNNDPIDGMQLLTSKSNRGDLWRVADVLNTPYLYATQGAKQWTAGEVVAAGTLRNTANGQVYKTTAGGTCGNATPAGTGTGINDGGVTWDYQGVWNAGHTVFFYDEDGYGAINGWTTARWGVATVNSRGMSMNVDEVSGDMWLRDEQHASDILRRSTASGVQLGGLVSLAYGGALNGAAMAISSGLYLVNNAAPTTVASITIGTAGQVRGVSYLLHNTPNTTYAKANFNFVGAVDMVVPQFGVVLVLVEPTASGQPFLVPLNF